MATFGEKMHTLRKRLNKSQIEMADELTERYGIKMTQTKLSALESRETVPKQELLVVLADYLGVHPAAFLQDAAFRSGMEAEHIQTRRDVNFVRKLLAVPVPANDFREAWQPIYDDDEYMDS